MSTTKTSTICLILLFIFTITSCVYKKDKKKIDDEIVLKIGSFEITRYEYEKNKTKEIEQQTNRNIEDWIKKYITNSYFLADAYNRKYDTISSIRKVVNYVSITMLGQYKGYLWNKVEEPKLIISEKTIKEIYRKQHKLFDLEYFLFPDKMSLKTILGNNTDIKTEADFKNLKDKCQTNSVKYINIKLLYPFYELEPVKEQIYALKQGSILSIPFKNGKFLIAHLKNIIEIRQKKFDEERENICTDLKHIKEEQIVYDKQYSIFNKAGIMINDQVSDLTLKYIKDSLPSEACETFLADTILKYSFNEQSKVLLVADFLDYYHNNPLMFVITDKESLIEILKGIVEEKYLYTESEKLGITSEKKFILDKRDYMNRYILNAYYKNNFPVSKVSNKDMYNFYNSNKQSFSQCKTCYVSVFTFKDLNSAYFSLNLVNKIISQNGINNPSDTSMMGLLSYHPNEIIETRNKEYPTTIVHNILVSKMNTLVGPLKLSNQIKIFVKTREEGQEIQPFELVKETIENQLIAENMEILKDKKVKELISKYPIVIDKIRKKRE